MGPFLSASSSAWSISVHGARMLTFAYASLSANCWYNTCLSTMFPIFDTGFWGDSGFRIGSVFLHLAWYSNWLFFSFSLSLSVASSIRLVIWGHMHMLTSCQKNFLLCVRVAAPCAPWRSILFVTVTSAISFLLLLLTLSAQNRALSASPLYPMTLTMVVL